MSRLPRSEVVPWAVDFALSASQVPKPICRFWKLSKTLFAGRHLWRHS